MPYPGLLQPLAIPTQAWTLISVDFIEQFPLSEGKSVILVVIDRFIKFVYFMSMSHPFTDEKVAKMFMDIVFQVILLPTSIVSDIDKIFLSNFWQQLFKTLGTKLNISLAYHSQLFNSN